MAMGEENARLLGEVIGKLDVMLSNQDAVTEKLGQIDDRLRVVENRAAKSGLVTGAMAAIGIELVKAKLGLTGGGGA